MINGTEQISDINGISDFTPTTPGGKWDTLYFDLSDYSGSDFTVTMQSACRSPGTSWSDYGDNVFIDNLVIGNAPIVNLGIDQIVCVGETVNLDAGSGSGYTYEWVRLSSGEQLDITQTIDVTTDGDYIAIVTNSSGLFDTDTVKVTFSKPVANAGSDQNVCEGDTITLESVTEWTGYEWQIGETTRSIEYTVLMDSTFTLTVTDSVGCTDVDEVVITSLDLPVLDLGEDVTICPGETHSLNAGSGFSYLWSDNSNSQILIVSDEDTYWVQITDGNGCKNTDTVDVILFTAPVVDLGDDILVCQGEDSTLDAGAGFASYAWSNFETTQTISVNQAGSYTVTVIDGNGCTGTDEVNFGFYTAPDVNLGGNVEFCIGTTFTLDAGGGFDSYLWSNGLTTQTVDTDTVGLFSVTVTDANGCQDTDQKYVSFLPDYTIDLGEDKDICEGDSILLNPSFSYQTYLWSNGSTSPTIYVKEEGSYSLTAVDAHGCNAIGDTIAITVNPLPVLDLGPDQEGCVGYHLTLDAGAGYTTYNWNSGGSLSQTYIVRNDGTQTLVVTNEFGCMTSDQIYVSFNQPETVEIGDYLRICVGEDTTLDAGPGFASYLWSDGSTGQTLSISEPGTYTVEVIDQNGCPDSDNITVSQYYQTNADLGEDTGFCAGSSIIIGPAEAAVDYLWSDGSTTQYLDINVVGTYWIKVVDSNGCSDSDTISIAEYSVPHVDLGADTAFCDPGVAFVLDAGNEGASYLWADFSTSQTIEVYITRHYTVQVTNDLGCSSEDGINVTIYSLPNVSIEFDGTFVFTSFSGEEYIWYLDDKVITGAVSRIHTVEESGTYQVYAIDENGCSAYSLALDVTVDPPATVGFDDSQINNLVEIYPNPTTGKFVMKFNGDITPSEIRILDITGNVVYHEKGMMLPYNYEKPIDLNNLSKGVYLIMMEYVSGWDVRKLLIE